MLLDAFTPQDCKYYYSVKTAHGYSLDIKVACWCQLLQCREQRVVLQRNNLSTDGVLIKAQDGVYANLRWDLGVDSYEFYWDMLNHKSDAKENYQRLSDFARGIAGGGGIPRDAYIFDNVNVPEVGC